MMVGANSSGVRKPTSLAYSLPFSSRIIKVGVHLILKSVDRGSESDGIRMGITFFVINSTTVSVGYVTASICMQPIQPGLKKSRRTGFFSALDLDKAFSMSLSHTMLAPMISLLF